jgi:uncharacterized membrane protein HdeD (DUF308 family)
MFADIAPHYWWTTLLRGVLWILFGLFAFAQPGMSLLTLTFLFGMCVLADGMVDIVGATSERAVSESSWILMLPGLIGVGVGVLMLFMPVITAFLLLVCIAAWAIVTGLFEIVAAIRLRKEMQGEFWLGFSGLVSVAFGLFLLARPGAGMLAVLWTIAFYAIVMGVAFVIEAFAARATPRAVRG